jgi:hypothetical protein
MLNFESHGILDHGGNENLTKALSTRLCAALSLMISMKQHDTRPISERLPAMSED